MDFENCWQQQCMGGKLHQSKYQAVLLKFEIEHTLTPEISVFEVARFLTYPIIILFHPTFYLADCPVLCLKLCPQRPTRDWPYSVAPVHEIGLGVFQNHALAMREKEIEISR